MTTTEPQDPNETYDEGDTFKVVTADGKRTLFEGTDKDVAEYVQNNYPHVHAEPNMNYGENGPQPDVHVITPDGAKRAFVGGAWTEYDENGGE
jgi:hypothetical protein